MHGIIYLILLVVAALCACFGLRLHGYAMIAVMDSLDELSGSKTGVVFRFLVLMISTLLMIASCGIVLLVDMIVVVVRANTIRNRKAP